MRIVLIIALLLGFTIVHIVKLIRLYLIVLDEKITFERFVPAYLRTTLVNMLVPFKLGEIYRLLVFWRLSKVFKTGLFTVLIDRFFDTFALLLILLPYQLLITGKIGLPVILLTCFIAVLIFGYVIFPSTYTFLNRYIITSKTSGRSMSALKGLEVVNEWYEYVRSLVRGRYGLLTILSVIAWGAELTVFASFSKYLTGSFTVADFGNYIESILSGGVSGIGRTYTLCGIIIIAIYTLISIVFYLTYKRRSCREAGPSACVK